MKLFKRLPQNTNGRDFVVGDLHGSISQLESAMDEIKFDKRVDRMLSVGDLVDKGTLSELMTTTNSQIGRSAFKQMTGLGERVATDLVSSLL